MMHTQPWRVIKAITVVAALTLSVASTRAQEATPGWSAQYGLVAGANPTVLGLRGGVTHIAPLYRERGGILWDTARVEAGVDALVNPSFADVAVRLFVEPVVFFDVTLRGGVRSFYDGLGFGLAPLSGYDVTPPAAHGDDPDREAGLGWFAELSPRLKGAFGPVIVANTLSATRYSFPNVDARYLEEPIAVSVIERTDWVLGNELTVLYRFRNVPAPFLAVGPSYRATWVPWCMARAQKLHPPPQPRWVEMESAIMSAAGTGCV